MVGRSAANERDESHHNPCNGYGPGSDTGTLNLLRGGKALV
jgi:hypothetical protein